MANVGLQKRLEHALIGFFIGIALFVIGVYLIAPSVYNETLQVSSSDRYPFISLLFLCALLSFMGVVMYGILAHWRWLFWLLLIAFSAAVLQIPAIVLEVSGLISNPFPDWYDWCRMAVALVQVILAIRMWRFYQRFGVWTAHVASKGK